MKVLFVSYTSSKDRSSYTQRLINLREGLEKNGAVAETLYLGDYFFKTPSFTKALNIPMFIEKMTGFDFVHAGTSSACFVMGLSKKLRNVRLIYDIHGGLEEYFLNERVFKFVNYVPYLQSLLLDELSIRNSDCFITCSKPLLNRLIDRGIALSSATVIRNGVDTNLFKPKTLRSNNQEFVVTYAGAFQKWQGIENFVNAARIIKEPDIKFRIIGFKSEDYQLKSYLGKTLKDKVELIDSLDKEHLIDQLCLSDILIIPRNRNYACQLAFPTKFAEYISIGKPVIVTDVDETASFVRKYNCGFVCDPSAHSIARTIVGAKNLPKDKLLKMGRNARILAEKAFDLRVLGTQYFNFLRQNMN